jgi:uncharacterized protein YdaU (DUF1376 family)
MTKIRRVDFYPSDWNDGLAGLDIGSSAAGVYIQTISFCYAAGVPSLPEDALIDRLARYFGDHPRTIRAAVDRLVKAAKFTRVDGEVEPNRVRVELERALNRAAKNREVGAKGGRPSTKSTTSKTQVVSETKPYQSSSINQQPSTIKDDDESSSCARDPLFDLVDRIVAIVGVDERWGYGLPNALKAMFAQGYTEAEALAAAVSAASVTPKPRTFKYLISCMENDRNGKQSRAPERLGNPHIQAARDGTVERAIEAVRRSREGAGV